MPGLRSFEPHDHLSSPILELQVTLMRQEGIEVLFSPASCLSPLRVPPLLDLEFNPVRYRANSPAWERSPLGAPACKSS